MLESDLDLQYNVLTQCFFSLVDLERREIIYSSSADKRIEIIRYWYQEHYLLPELQSLPLQVHLHHQKHEQHHHLL